MSSRRLDRAGAGAGRNHSTALEENVRAIRRWERGILRARSFAEQASDAIARTAGSGPVLVLHVLWFGGWVAVNAGTIPGMRPFDPFPFHVVDTFAQVDTMGRQCHSERATARRRIKERAGREHVPRVSIRILPVSTDDGAQCARDAKLVTDGSASDPLFLVTRDEGRESARAYSTRTSAVRRLDCATVRSTLYVQCGTDPTGWRSDNTRMSIMPDVPVRPSTKGDERWERWVAKGVAHDDDARRRAKVLGVLVLSTIAVVVAVTLGLN